MNTEDGTVTSEINPPSMNWMQINDFFMLNRIVWLIKMDIELDICHENNLALK